MHGGEDRRGAHRKKDDPVAEAERQRRHREGRGKKQSLSDLSRELPSTRDLENYTASLSAESDRGAAIMAAALVERALEDAIRSRLADPGDGIADSWFDGINAPFKSFAAKIVLGRALGIYGPGLETRLNHIKNVRNAFAHRSIPLDFTHPTLVDVTDKLSFVPARLQPEMPHKIVFGAVCVALAHSLGTYSQEKGHELMPVRFP